MGVTIGVGVTGCVSAKLGPHFILGHFSRPYSHLLEKIAFKSAKLTKICLFLLFLQGRRLSNVEIKVKNGIFAIRRTSHVDSGRIINSLILLE